MSPATKNRCVKSVVLKNFGTYDEVAVEAHPLEYNNCKENDLEIDVKYCGINFADIYTRLGLIPRPSGSPSSLILGLECAGIVKDIGEQVTTFKKGQRILCYCGEGGLYRETIIIDQKFCFAIPDEINFDTAVALPANYLTAYFCLFEFGNLRPGHNVLIHSCAGGVGWAATQLARTVENVNIIGTASGSFKFDAVKQNGVDRVISSRDYFTILKEDEELRHLKFDLIIDNISGGNIERSQMLLNTFGKVVVIGANCVVNKETKLNIFDLLKLWWSTKSITVTNLIMRNNMVGGLHLGRIMMDHPEIAQKTIKIIFDLCIKKKIIPRIDSAFEFDQVVEAMKRLSNRKNIGKVILKL